MILCRLTEKSGGIRFVDKFVLSLYIRFLQGVIMLILLKRIFVL